MTIDIRDLSFTYHGETKPSLNHIHLSIPKGECVLLCGKSGCGKTTLTRLLNGLIPNFFHGEFEGYCSVLGFINGKDAIESYVPYVGSVFQNPKTQYFNTNTTSELAFPCENIGMAKDEIETSINRCASKFQSQKLLNRNIFNLSGGEKQITAVMAATILSPSLLVLDEPTSNLDTQAIQKLHDMLLSLKKEGVTIVLAEHRLAWALDLVDSFYYMDKGKIISSFSSKEFSQLSQEQLYSMGLRTNDLTPYIKQVLLKQSQSFSYDDSFISIKDLSIGYNKQKIYTIKDMYFSHHEIIGIMGHNGLGKTTLIKTLCGLLKPISGTISINNKKANSKQLQKNSYLIMQDVNYQLFNDSVLNEVTMDNENEETCKQVLKLLGLDEYINKHPMALSGGQKQRCAIACSFVSNKQIIYMDEPTSGLDGYHMQQVGAFIKKLKESGKTIVIITHDEELAALYCDRVYRLEDTK